MEYFNECILMLTMYTILCYSPFILSQATKFKLGYATIGIVAIHLACNLFFIFKETVLLMRLKCRRYRHMRRYKKWRKLMQKRIRETSANRHKRMRAL